MSCLPDHAIPIVAEIETQTCPCTRPTGRRIRIVRHDREHVKVLKLAAPAEELGRHEACVVE